jgi:hypothetical protein
LQSPLGRRAAIEQKSNGEARAFIDQAEAHYRRTVPRHWWGELQVRLIQCRLMRMAGDPSWVELARAIRDDAAAAGYQRDAAFAARLLEGDIPMNSALMFL